LKPDEIGNPEAIEKARESIRSRQPQMD